MQSHHRLPLHEASAIIRRSSSLMWWRATPALARTLAPSPRISAPAPSASPSPVPSASPSASTSPSASPSAAPSASPTVHTVTFDMTLEGFDGDLSNPEIQDQVAQTIAESMGLPGITGDDVTITGPDADGGYTVVVDVTGANGGEGYTDPGAAQGDVLAAIDDATAGGAGSTLVEGLNAQPDISGVTDAVVTTTASPTASPTVHAVSFGMTLEGFDGDLSKWDASNVTDMKLMFYNARSFNGDLSKWDVSMVTAMRFRFQ